MSVSSCFALALTLGVLPFPITFDESVIIDKATNLTLSSVTITPIVVPDDVTRIGFSSTESHLDLPFGAQYQLSAVITGRSPSDPLIAEVGMRLMLTPGAARFTNKVKPDTCLIEESLITSCNITLQVADPFVLPIEGMSAGSAVVDDAILEVVLQWMNATLRTQQVCVAFGQLLAKVLVNIPDQRPAPLPPPSPSLKCDLRTNELMQMAENVLDNLPTIAGFSFGLLVPTANAIRLEVTTTGFPVNPLVLGEGSWIFIPPNTGISLDLILDQVTCPSSTAIQILANITVLNIRLKDADGSTFARLFDQLEAPIAELITEFLRGISSILPANESSLIFSIPNQEAQTAPFYTMALTTAGSTIIGIAAAIASLRRRPKGVLIDGLGNEIPRCRIFLRDMVLIVGCCFTMVCFAWSNQTGAATVKLGGTLSLYNFSLANSVQDMWEAGLYALSIFIALFCGIYPYVKLLTILLFAVVLHRPQSKILRFIDTFGKFSLLDSFVMIILAESLVVPGVVEVEMQPSFWVFLAATVSSMALGNYATNAVITDGIGAEEDYSRRRITERAPLLHAESSSWTSFHGRFNSEEIAPTNAIRSDPSVLLELERSRAHSHRFRPIAAGISVVLMGIGLGLTCIIDTIEFRNSGIGSIVTGTRIRYTVLNLLRQCPIALLTTGVATIYVIPLLFAGGFRRTHVLAAWCAPDTFLLACLAALLQLKQFIVFVLGSTFRGVITIEAVLLWPTGALGAAVGVLWILILNVVFF